MELYLIQVAVGVVGIFLSILALLIKIRKEFIRNQKELVEAKVAEEKRIIMLENRIALFEQKTFHTFSILNERLTELSQRLDLLCNLVCKQVSKCNNEE
ncbi:MAG: hypothetical protein N2560_10170 [Ignavibacteria bacterium]|nr:hypothetical protein [Ignavibacteria bacterium]